MTECVFCAIACGDIPTKTVYEDQDFRVIADGGPIRPGHLLVLTREHYPYFDDLPEPLAAGLIALGQRLARILKTETGVERVGFLLSGGDIAHVHAHIVPMHEKTDLTSRRYVQLDDVPFGPAPAVSEAETDALLNRLRTRMS